MALFWRTMVFWILSTGLCYAQVQDSLYRELLTIAQKRVQERQLKASPQARLSIGAIDALKLGERFYRLGEEWRVQFTPTSDPNVAAMARGSSIDNLEAVKHDASTYLFRVVALKGADLAEIQVRQVLAAGENRMDPMVEQVVLSLNRRFIPVKKEIHYRGGRPTLELKFSEAGTMAMGMEATPVDLPNLGVEEGTPMVDALSGKPGLQFVTEDVYGRTVTAVWLQGEVWPSVVTTTAGTARVVR